MNQRVQQPIPLRPHPSERPQRSSGHPKRQTAHPKRQSAHHKRHTGHPKRPTGHPKRQIDMHPPPLPPEQHLACPAPSETLPVEGHIPPSHSDPDLFELPLKKLYHYLMDFPVMQLRRIAKVWDRRQNGLKKAIVARIYLYILDRIYEDGHTLENVLATNSHLDSFERWVSNMRLRVVWDKPPSRKDLLNIIGAVESDGNDPEFQPDPNNLKRPFEKTFPDSELSLSEFARLLLLIKASQSVKRAIFEARREALREDDGLDRLKFWATLVEPHFNAKSFMPVLKVDGPFEGIDARRLPSRFRNGTDLMNAYGAARQSFLVYLERWRRSGSNDPSMFMELIPRNGRGGGISRTGKRSLIIFKLMECWNENQDALMLGLTCKFTIGATIRGVRSGTPGLVRKVSEDEDDTDVGSEVRSIARSKRRRRISGKVEDSPDVGEYAKGVLHAVRMIASVKAGEQKTEQQLEREEEQYKREARMNKLEAQASLMKPMEEARRMIRDHQDDDEFRNMAQMFYNEMKVEFMNLRK